MTVTGPLETSGRVWLSLSHLAVTLFTRLTPVVFVFTFRITVSIVNVMVSSVALLVSLLKMSPRFHVAIVPLLVSTGGSLRPGTDRTAGSSLTTEIVRT